MGKRKTSSVNGNCTPPTSKRLSELLLGNPVQALFIGLLCASWGFRALPKVLADNGDDRNGTFQILADGTQDIAALVGLFATDSVERYSVDYSRGYLSVAMATCSLLGIMGYVRALLKLALGSKSCQDSAFPTAPVRAILGVAESDRLPKDELIKVTYISRTTKKSDNTVQFRAPKRLYHTQESFPGAKPIFQENQSGRKAYDYNILCNSYSAWRSRWVILIPIWGSLLLTAAATSFPIVLVSHHWTWTRIVASFGMFFALATSSMMWAYVYVEEQKPYWGNSDTLNGASELEEFAVMEPLQQDSRQIISALRTVTGPLKWLCRVLSLVAAAVISLGYVCQYIEIRKTTTTQSAWWLGFQTALTVIRMIIWIWDPEFDDHTDFDILPRPFREPPRFTGQDLATIHFSTPSSLNEPELTFPLPLLDRLALTPIIPMLKQAKTIASSELSEHMRYKLLNECTAVWHFPKHLFSKWLAYRSGNIQRTRDPSLHYSCSFISIGGSRPWVDGEIILIPVLRPREHRSNIEVATTPYEPYGSSSKIYFNELKLNTFPQRFPPTGHRIEESTLEEALAELLKELGEAITALEREYPEPAESEKSPTTVDERSILYDESEVVIEMENMTDTPLIQSIPLPNSAAPQATTTALPPSSAASQTTPPSSSPSTAVL